ncbi:MAG: glycoside hydrolase [Bacteroidota bacterium]|nr:glycoside hydrolase [Bacteroidota bacterium]
MMKYSWFVILIGLSLPAFSQQKLQSKSDFIVANGQMPALAKDKYNTLHLVYGSGDSILYSQSADKGNTFTIPALISVIPHVYTFATRGPQIASTKSGIVVTACTSSGIIYSFCKNGNGKWIQSQKVTDIDSTAKEGLMSLSADGDNVYAVWLDLRGNQRNKIYSAKSSDGGKSWSKNIKVYSSPDTTVCECCKPSVVVKGNNVYVMFRNWLKGSRDLYIIQSSDGGDHFTQAQKLGAGTWKLNGCPMDGGGLAVDKNGTVQTVWRRENKIYSATPGTTEKEVGEGKGCTIETVNGNNVYAWTDKEDVVIMNQEGTKEIVGKGRQPIIKALDDQHIICIWENEKQIHASIEQL